MKLTKQSQDMYDLLKDIKSKFNQKIVKLAKRIKEAGVPLPNRNSLFRSNDKKMRMSSGSLNQDKQDDIVNTESLGLIIDEIEGLKGQFELFLNKEGE